MRRAGLSGSFWPTERQLLLLRAALLRSERGAEAWRLVRPTLRFEELESASTGVLPLLQRQVEHHAPDDGLLPRLRGLYRRTWYVNQLRLGRLGETLRALQAAGTEPLVVSSWELPVRYYGDLGLRVVPSLHLLVRPERVQPAKRALAAHGWGGPVARMRHSAWFAQPGGDRLALYWQLFHEFTDPAGCHEGDDLWEPAIDLSIADVIAHALGPADELLNVCIAGARLNVPPSILWAADAHVVLETAAGELDWDRFVRQATRLRATSRARDALSFLKRELDALVPDDVLAALKHVQTRPRERLAHRVASVRLGPLGAPPESLTRFLRLTAERPIPRALAGLPAFLRDEWGLERRSQVPLRAVRKGAARLARMGRPTDRTSARA